MPSFLLALPGIGAESGRPRPAWQSPPVRLQAPKSENYEDYAERSSPTADHSSLPILARSGQLPGRAGKPRRSAGIRALGSGGG